MERENITFKKQAKVIGIVRENSQFVLEMKNQPPIVCDKLMLCSGSSREGYQFAQDLGHQIEPLVPSLFTFKVDHPFIDGLMGQSVAKASVELDVGGHKWNSEGAVLITHWGLSGPAILKLSAFAAKELYAADYQGEVRINWLHHGNLEQVITHLWEHKKNNPNQKLLKSPVAALSHRIWGRLLEDQVTLTWHQMSKKAIRSVAERITHTVLPINGKGVFKEEFVTCGGVKRSEVDFKTMESKIVPSLYFSGEVLDIDGVTGGFNFQNAWSCSFIAAQNLD